MLVMAQTLNRPEQALVILPVDVFDQIPGERPWIVPALMRFEVGMP